MASFPLLTGHIDTRDQEIEQLRHVNRQLDEALRLERNKTGQIEAALREFRRITLPFYRILQAAHGEIESLGVSDGPVSSVAPQKLAAWENWKHKLGGLQAKFIDALLLHGAMTQTQLRIAVGCANGSVAGTVCALNKAGLITKNGGKIALKEL